MVIRCFVLKSCCYQASPSSLSPQHNNLNRRFKNNAKPVVTYFCSSGSSVCSWTMVPLDKSQTCRAHHTNVSSISGRVINDELADQLSQETYLILQINERRAPMLILADVCWLSFFTVPVLRSNILPLKPKKD